jgi:hypothetical protein
MSKPLVRCPRVALFAIALTVALGASLFATRRAEAEPAKQGAATANVLATESGRPTPGVDAPKVTPHKSVHHATAKVKTTTKAKTTTKTTKPAHVKPVKTHQPKAHVPRAIGAKPSAAPTPVSTKPATRV